MERDFWGEFCRDQLFAPEDIIILLNPYEFATKVNQAQF